MDVANVTVNSNWLPYIYINLCNLCNLLTTIRKGLGCAAPGRLIFKMCAVASGRRGMVTPETAIRRRASGERSHRRGRC